MSDAFRHAIAPWCAALGVMGLGVAFIAAICMFVGPPPRDKTREGK
jgi:hypothetical protein